MTSPIGTAELAALFVADIETSVAELRNFEANLRTLEKMQNRIKKAFDEPEKLTASNFDRLAALINPKLRALATQEVYPRGTTDEVSYEFAHNDDRDFHFKQVKDASEAEALVETLRQRADGSERWKFDRWLENGIKHQQTIIEVRRSGDETPAGYAIIHTDLGVEKALSGKFKPNFYLSLDLAAIYISPECRGMGFSSALRWAVASYVEDIIAAVEKMPSEDRASLEGMNLEVFLTGEAQSAGGARYLSSVLDKIEEYATYYLEEERWFGAVTVIDDIDFSDFPDCGYGTEAEEDYHGDRAEASIVNSPGH